MEKTDKKREVYFLEKFAINLKTNSKLNEAVTSYLTSPHRRVPSKANFKKDYLVDDSDKEEILKEIKDQINPNINK